MSTLNIQVTYDDNVHQFNLIRENLNWTQLVTVLQASILQATNADPFVLYYGLDGEAHEVNNQDTFSQLLSFPDMIGLHFYGNANQEKDKMKSVYILPRTNDAFKKLADLVDAHCSELENNHLLSRFIGLLASCMISSPGNYDDEIKQIEFWIEKPSKGVDCFKDMWKMRNNLMKKQGFKFFKNPTSGYPEPPHYNDAYPFGGREGYMRRFGGCCGPRSRFDHPAAFFGSMFDKEQDDENTPAENNEKTSTEYKETAAAELNSSDNDEEDQEEDFYRLAFGGPCGRPGFGRGGLGCGGFGGRGGFSGRGRHFGRPDFGGPGFGGFGFGKPNFECPESKETGFEDPSFGPYVRGRGGFGRGRGSHGRGGHFGGPGRFEKEPTGSDFDFLKSFGRECPHQMPPREQKNFYFA